MSYFTSGVPSRQAAEIELLLSREKKNKLRNWVEAGMSAWAWPSLAEVSRGRAESLSLSGNSKGFLGSLSQLPGS